MEHPPKPRLTLRVGIAGDAPDKLGPAAARIEEDLSKVFDAIATETVALWEADKDYYAPERPTFRLISGFAEGADRLAVRLCPADWQIEAVLPFPRDQFVDTFSNAAGHAHARSAFEEILKKAHVITELSPPPDRMDPSHGHAERETRHREKGYADAGGYFLRQIDLLIAVWDGKAPRTAGTGAIARQAFEGGIPVVWIAIEAKDHPPRLIKGFNKQAIATTPETDATGGPIKEALAPIVAAPARRAPRSRGSPQARLQDFYAEKWRKGTCFAFFDCLKRAANWQLPRFPIRFEPLERRLDEWNQFMADAPEADDLQGRIREILLRRFAWADSLAIYFSHRYRSAYVLCYLLSAIAVFIALASLQAHDDPSGKAPYVAAELLVIGIIIGTVWRGRHARWHERWIDYRALAENLRHGRFLAFAGEFGNAQERSDQAPWMVWYLRATMREVGLPTAVIDGTYQWRVLNTTMVHEIDEQYEYHKSNSRSARRLDHMLHWVGIACFGVTCLVLVLFLISYDVEWALSSIPETDWYAMHFLDGIKSVMILFSAGLPALGAALAGIRVLGDFEGSKERSVKMMQTLVMLKGNYAAAKDRNIGLDRAAELLLDAARLMSEDVSAWQELYGRKRLTLPA
jgi:hypothetical protein